MSLARAGSLALLWLSARREDMAEALRPEGEIARALSQGGDVARVEL